MKEPDYGREKAQVPLTVKDALQARLLSDPTSSHYFEPFVARDATASEAAQEIGCNLDTMLYRIRTFTQAGLLNLVRLEPRRGRPIKVYRSSADAYFVPFGITPFEDSEARIRRQSRENEDIFAPRLAKIARQSGREGRHIYRDSQGEFWSSSSVDATVPPLDLDTIKQIRKNVYETNGPIAETLAGEFMLTEAEAKDLLFEFYNLWRRFKKEPDSTSKKRYFYQFALVPMDD
jgi:hypothetical protein